MSRKLHDVFVSAGVASVAGVALGYILKDMPMGLALGAALPITWSASTCRSLS